MQTTTAQQGTPSAAAHAAPLCIDCTSHLYQLGDHICRTTPRATDLVTGGVQFESCQHMRERCNHKVCGPAGLAFTPRAKDSAHPQSWRQKLNALRDSLFVRYLCRGQLLDIAQSGTGTKEAPAAGGVDVSLSGMGQRMHICANSHKRCAACPRFKAHRESLAQGEPGCDHLHVPSGVHGREAHSFDGDAEGAQVAHLDGHVPVTTTIHSGSRDHQHLDAVLAPVAPRIQQAKPSAQQRDAKGHALQPSLFHTHLRSGAIISSSQVITYSNGAAA